MHCRSFSRIGKLYLLLFLVGVVHDCVWSSDGASRGSPIERRSLPPPVPQIPEVKAIPRASPPPRGDAALFNCADCNPQRRRWYADVNELRRAARHCGFDYLSVRITQFFAADTVQSRCSVYAHSLADDSLMVDSVVTAFRSPSMAEENVTVYHCPQQPLHLPPPSLFPLPHDDARKINAVVRRARTFQSTCVTRNSGKTGSWYFSLDGTGFLIEKGHLKTETAPATIQEDIAGTIEYRLETWGATPLHQSAQRSEHARPPELRHFVVNDSVTVCRVRIKTLSPYGLRRCILFCGMRSDTVNFSGEKHRDETITLNAQPDDSLLRIRVDDIYGNTTEGRLPIFITRRKEQAERAELRMVEQMTKERAIGSPVATAAYLISRFTGNPVSWLAREVLTRQAKDALSATGDFYQTRPPNEVSFPFTGKIQSRLFEHSSATYRIRFFTDKISLNGTQIAAFGNPTLRRIDGEQECCGFNLTAPLISGKYPASWSIDTSGTTQSAANGSSLLLCASARRRGESITLYGIPCMLARPARHAEFSLYHSTTSTTADTLTVTWCIRYVDRTSELFHQQFDVGPRGVTAVSMPKITVIRTAPHAFVNRAGEQCLIMEVEVEGSKEIFRIDAFVHSLLKNQVVGWGAASCPG